MSTLNLLIQKLEKLQVEANKEGIPSNRLNILCQGDDGILQVITHINLTDGYIDGSRVNTLTFSIRPALELADDSQIDTVKTLQQQITKLRETANEQEDKPNPTLN